ncbi:IS110 family RNA-guided transposase [Paenibacillus roseipurpureus]|uniref:IS110 family transposase n=1 Tax=Paenibacillus roseopurpureus TaxID=2918901 RepID=A0AA96LMQ5_9BACL|nr:IS110 family transposase [Paenibacillus sp. MBLB1832]WNR43844.1 IS110 family transposase [Paenibacillus sp. MBLB1832]
MKFGQKYIGLDVSKEKIAVAVADEGRDAPRYVGAISHDPGAIRKLIKQLGDPKDLAFCYEAGPTGYELYRWIVSMGAQCEVIAPSLLPKRPGDQVKTDRRDALQLAQLYRSGELTSIYVPDRDDEALRDLVRAREDAREDLHRARQRLGKFLLRHHIHHPSHMKKRWTKMYRKWLGTLTFERKTEQTTFNEYLHAIYEVEQRQQRLETAMLEQATTGTKAELVKFVQTLRGIARITAITLVAEIGSFARFPSPTPLMAYLGLVPREYSSGQSVKRGKMTKAGNKLMRKSIIESAWSYRHKPAIKGDLAKRLEGMPAEIQVISWRAQERLHRKYMRMVHKGKPATVAIGAVARELVGFLWAAAMVSERPATT